MNASTLAQSARTPSEWKAVVSQWQEAIALMKAVPPSGSNYNTAQQKIVEYQNYLNSAQQRAASIRNQTKKKDKLLGLSHQ